jgi:hypothetical protein
MAVFAMMRIAITSASLTGSTDGVFISWVESGKPKQMY